MERAGRVRSVLAAAAYRSGQALWNERENKTTNFAARQDVAFTEILYPDDAPEWAQDRGSLWNAVEAMERRKDARLAKEIEFAFPRELSPDGQIAAARFFAQTFTRQGLVVDLTIHDDRRHDAEDYNPHCHLLMTTREITGSGFAAKKRRDLDKKQFIYAQREACAAILNATAKAENKPVTVEHRSFKTLGIDRAPTRHRGVNAAEREAKRAQARAGYEGYFAEENSFMSENSERESADRVKADLVDQVRRADPETQQRLMQALAEEFAARQVTREPERLASDIEKRLEKEQLQDLNEMDAAKIARIQNEALEEHLAREAAEPPRTFDQHVSETYDAQDRILRERENKLADRAYEKTQKRMEKDAIFRERMEAIYKDPDEAWRTFEKHRDSLGQDKAFDLLEKNPKRFGDVRGSMLTPEQKRARQEAIQHVRDDYAELDRATATEHAAREEVQLVHEERGQVQIDREDTERQRRENRETRRMKEAREDWDDERDRR